MNLTILLRKLIEIEQCIGVESDSTMHKKLQDLQDSVLQMQKESVGKLKAEHRTHATSK